MFSKIHIPRRIDVRVMSPVPHPTSQRVFPFNPEMVSSIGNYAKKLGYYITII
jgi:hypothetical protein